MSRPPAPWLLLPAAYALALLPEGADTAVQPLPWALVRLRDAVGTLPLQLAAALLTALAFGLAAGLARRLVPDPWATGAVVAVALSPPALACATRVGPDPVAAALLTTALVLTVRVREDPRRTDALGAAAALAVLPWFGVGHAVAGLLVLAALVRWTLRRGRPVVALVCVEVCLASAVSLIDVGPPASPVPPPGDGPLRLVGALVGPDAGVLLWAPVLALAVVGAVALWRSHRDRLARLLPERATAEAVAALCGSVALATLVVSAVAGLAVAAALPAAAALSAWGLRRTPRLGSALALLTVGLSVWRAVALVTGTASGWF